MKRRAAQSQAGSTIIEVLIATLVVSMVMTAVAAVMTVSVKNTGQLRYRAAASSQAQSALEIFRRERNLLGWESFYAETPGGTYCLNTLPANTAAYVALNLGSCSGTYSHIGNNFEREAIVTKGATDVRVVIVVTWSDGTRTPAPEVRLTQIFRKFN
jgi:type II secretory pathway pseudopilin PulG